MSSSERALRPLPLWARWVLAIVVGGAVLAGIVIAVDRSSPGGATSEAGAEAEINRESDIVIGEDEAPRFANLPAGAAPAVALERAIEGDVRRRIARDQMVGPLQRLSCTPAGAGSAGRNPYRCTVESAGIAYPFLAVVEEHQRRLIWCKVDKPPSATEAEIPVSASCQT
jgi:hypothetical protein